LLLEPQRTNVILYSDGLEVSNAFNGTLTKNNITSPDGYVNASLFTPTPNTNAGITTTTITTSAISYTFSIYLKGSVAGQKVRFFGDLQNVTEFTLTTSFARYTATFTGAVGAQSFYIGVGSYISPVQNNPFYLYGAQLEEGAYATSYIPTLGASVTRVADAASKTSASALIGQTEGTIFWEFQLETSVATGHESIINIDGGSFSNTIYILKGGNGSITAEMYVGGVLQAAFSISSQPAGTYKAAIGYANNNTAFFINGVQVGTTDTSCSVPTTSRIQLGNNVFGPSTDKTAQVLLFKTRLTNSQLAELTA
jgi:hypothetical protein